MLTQPTPQSAADAPAVPPTGMRWLVDEDTGALSLVAVAGGGYAGTRGRPAETHQAGPPSDGLSVVGRMLVRKGYLEMETGQKRFAAQQCVMCTRPFRNCPLISGSVTCPVDRLDGRNAPTSEAARMAIQKEAVEAYVARGVKRRAKDGQSSEPQGRKVRSPAGVPEPRLYVYSRVAASERKLECTDDLANLDQCAQHRHSIVEVDALDLRFALSQLHRAHRSAPLSTTSTVRVLKQSKLRKTWLPYLKAYSLLGSEIRDGVKWEVYRRKAGTRSAAAKHVDQIRACSEVMVMHAKDAALGQSLYATFNLETGKGEAYTLVDTGANANVVTEDFARARGLGIRPSHRTITGVNGVKEKARGETTVMLEVEGRRFEVACLVHASLPGGLDMILGQEFLKEHEACVLFRRDNLVLELDTGGSPVRVERPYCEKAVRSCPNSASIAAMSTSEAKRLRRAGMLYQLVVERQADEMENNEPLPGVRDDGVAHKRSRDEMEWEPTRPVPFVKPPNGQVNIIIRDFKVQTDIPRLLQPVIDAYRENVMSGKPPNGEVPRDYRASIELLPGATPRMLRAYRLTPKELQELNEQVQKLLAKGWIRPSSSAWGAPVLFAPKSDGGLRMCVDYRMLNAATKKLNYPMPHAQESLDSFKGSKVFSTLDLVAGFHQISMEEADKEKTAFRTADGLFEYNVMPMGLANAPAIFQRAMNDIVGKIPGSAKFVRVYMDDIIIHSRNMEEHVEHLRSVLEALKRNGYCCRADKCIFGAPSVPYLGHVVSGDGLAVDPAKVALVKDWPAPTDVNQIRSFVGLVQYFRRFIKDLATHLAPMTALTKKDVPFLWSDACQAAFNHVKEALICAPVLAMPDVNKAFQVYTDASIHGCGGILMQEGQVVAYCGKKFTKTQTAWTTTEQELYALVYALETWRCYLEGPPVELFTDHQPLIWLATQPHLSRKQTRWVIFLQRFDVVYKYVPGKVNPADPVSRAPHLTEAITPTDTLEEYDSIMAFMVARSEMSTARVFTVQTQPGHRSARLLAKEGGEKRAKIAKSVRFVDELELAETARAEQSRARPKTGREKVKGKVSKKKPQREQAKAPAVNNPVEPGRGTAAQPQRPLTSQDLWNLRQIARMGGDSAVADALMAKLPVPLPEPEMDDEGPLPEIDEDPLLAQQAEGLSNRELRMDAFLDAVKEGYNHDAWFGKPEHTTRLEFVGEYWFKEHALVLPDYKRVREAALYQVHDAPWAGHVGRDRTQLALKTLYWWPGMGTDAQKYVHACDKCQRNKAHHQLKEHFLAPLPVPERPWMVVGIDMITQLPVSRRGYDAIGVMVCHFSKMVHLTPCTSDLTSAGIYAMFRRDIFRLHGMPLHIVSDRGTQFTADLWQQFCRDQGIKSSLTTAYQPSTDGMVERRNKVLAEMLRSYVNTSHTDWCTLLDSAEFAINKTSFGGACPFELVYQHVPLSPPEAALFQGLPLGKGNGSREARLKGTQWVQCYRTAKQLLHQAKDRMKSNADLKRGYRVMEVGDRVLVSSRHMQLKRPASAKKFCPLFVGPFKVLERIGSSAYRLELPEKSKMHPVLHVSKLWKYNESLSSPVNHAPVLMEDEDLFEVQDILNRRGPQTAPHYLVQWKGYDCLYNTWEPADRLHMCKELIDAYEARGATVPTATQCMLVIAEAQCLPLPPPSQ